MQEEEVAADASFKEVVTEAMEVALGQGVLE